MKNILEVSSLIAIITALLLPSSAFAGSSWSIVDVEQWQTGAHASSIVQGTQEFYIETKTALFGGAEAYSDSWGSQFGKVKDSGGASLEQLQKGNASSALVWGTDAPADDCDNSDPCQADMVNATAETSGYVQQIQKAKSDRLTKLSQEGSISQHSIVDGNRSEAEGWAKQDLLVDAKQKQAITGETHSEGLVINPLHKVWDVKPGSKLFQTVRVAVDNWLEF